jgi:hypothetical protein
MGRDTFHISPLVELMTKTGFKALREQCDGDVVDGDFGATGKACSWRFDTGRAYGVWLGLGISQPCMIT